MAKNITQIYQRVHIEALVISVISLILMIGCIIWSYQNYNEKTDKSYVQYRGRTIPIFDNTKELNKKNIKHLKNTQ